MKKATTDVYPFADLKTAGFTSLRICHGLKSGLPDAIADFNAIARRAGERSRA